MVGKVADFVIEEAKEPPRSKRDSGISAHLALINFLKGMIGPGCFSLPLAFKIAGLWTSFILVFVIGFLTCVCMSKLVKCSRFLSRRNPALSTLDYGQMAAESFRSGFPKLRPLARTAHILVNISLILLQIGVCSIYYIFVCDHAKEIIEQIQPSFVVPKFIYMIVAVVPFLCIAVVRNVLAMSFISLVGNIFMIVSIVLIFTQLLIAKHNWMDLPVITDFNGIVLASGAIIYSFEGQAIVLPLENRMKHGSEMTGWTGVLTTGLTLVTVIYVSCGFYGYITYGNAVRGSITLNLPNTPLNLVVKVLLMLVIFTGFLVTLYPMVEALNPFVQEKIKEKSKKLQKASEYILRIVLVILAVFLAVLIPNLEDIIPLVGVTAGMMLALIIPPVLDVNTFLPSLLEEKRYGRVVWMLMENSVYFFIGTFFLIAGVNTNIRHLMRK